MRALSFRHPVVDAILDGRKTVLVRRQRISHRGDLLLHASAAYGSAEREMAAAWRARGISFPDPPAEALGALLGVIQLIDVRPMSDADWDAALTSPPVGEASQLWAWVLDSPERFPEPIGWPGRVRLFEVPDAALARGVGAFR